MKILHFHFGKNGGAEGFFVHLVQALAKRGVEQKVVIRPHRRWKADIEKGAEIAFESHFRNASFDRISLPSRVGRFIKKWQPDAILAWMSRAGHLLPIAAPCLKFARLGDYPDQLHQFKNADVLICNTPGIAEHVRNMGWQRGVEVVTNFTNTDRVEPIPREKLNTPEGAPLICSVGRLVPRKGFDVLIHAIANIPGAYLWIVGEGQEEASLRKLSHALNLNNRIRFVGWKDDPRPYIAAADISAMASRHEPLGNVILEGWAQNVPVIAARSEGPTWLIQHEQNGLLVDIDDAAGFASASRQLLANPELAQKIVTGGNTSLHGRYSERGVIETYLQVFSGNHRNAKNEGGRAA